MLSELALKIGMGLVLLDPHQGEGHYCQLRVAEVLADLFNSVVQLAQAGSAIDVGRAGNYERGGRLQDVNIQQAHRRRGVDDARVVSPFHVLERGPEPMLSAHLIGQEQRTVCKRGIGR